MPHLPFGDSPTLHITGHSDECPTSGRMGNVTAVVWGNLNAYERRTKSEVSHKWADWLRYRCHPGGPQRFKAADKISSGQRMGTWATSPPPFGGVSNASERGSGPQVGELGTSPLPSGGSPMLENKKPNQQWPTTPWQCEPCN